jgi:cytochrome b subunit of formate dehydrogenase
MKCFVFVSVLSIIISGIHLSFAEDMQTGGKSVIIDAVCPPFFLRDESGNIINPLQKINAGEPYSPKQTCGAAGCHDYKKITQGFHFTQGAGEKPTVTQSERIQWVSTPGNYGGSWCSPAPLYRYLSPKQNSSPQAMDMTSFSFITAGCGDCHPGGGPAEFDRNGNRYDQFMRDNNYISGGENDFDGDYYQARWTETGVLEADCMICHQPEYNHAERKRHLQALNFRWAPTAAAGWASVTGSIQENEPLNVTYNTLLFDADGKISPHLVREPRNEACLNCHAQPGWKKRGANFSPRTDVHLRAGLKCVDCHPAGSKALDSRINEREMHQFGKGDDPGGQVRNDLDDTVLDCAYCHSNGHLGAPFARHTWLPPVHLDKIACQTCHIPERAVKPAQFQAGDVFNPGSKIPGKGKYLWVFYGPDMQYYNHYGNLSMMGFADKPTDPFKPLLAHYKGKIYPVNRVHSAWPAIEIEGRPELMQPKMGDIYKMWSTHFKDPSKYSGLSKIEDDNGDGVIEVNRAEEIDALIASVASVLQETNYPMEGKRVVWAMNERIYTSGTDYRQVKKEEWEASPYANVHKYNHDVYPAKAAIGINGCDDCHSTDSDFYFAPVLQYPFDSKAQPVSQSQFKIMNYNGGHKIYTSAAQTTALLFKWLTFIVITALLTHIILDFISRRRMVETNEKSSDGKNMMHQRFNVHYLTQHLLLMISVLILVISAIFLWGLRYPGAYWAAALSGGIDFWRIIHRGGALILIFMCFYHLIYSLVHPDGRRDFILMLPRRQDFKDFRKNLFWFFRPEKERPQFGRFTYFEKFDYWAVFWGCAIMIGSGLVMWFPEVVSMVIPATSAAFFESFKEAHAHEAVLAVLAIFIWHVYNVHFRRGRFPGTLFWVHGRISQKEMTSEHPLELKPR